MLKYKLKMATAKLKIQTSSKVKGELKMLFANAKMLNAKMGAVGRLAVTKRITSPISVDVLR